MALIDRALHDKLPEFAVKFFVVFSRFECAMKRSGVYAKGNEDRVDADWDKLAEDLGSEFFKDVMGKRIATTLIDKPPKKQILQGDGSLGWRDMGAVSSSRELFLAIRRARNNLLHGGKYRDSRNGNYTHIMGAERSDALLGESLAVLALTLEVREDIAKHF